MVHIPAGVYHAYKDPSINWNYTSEPEPECDDRRIELPRGKVIGGSSSINSMVYMRGHPMDYDRWADDFGLPDWRYERCLPYFKRCESSDRGENAWRGGSGPLGVTRGTLQNPLFDALYEAGGQSGQGTSDDLNGYKPEGIARLDSTTRHGRRCSAAVAHLKPALKRSSLTLQTRALSHRIILENNQARGIEYEVNGQVKQAFAAKEVIVSCGAIKTPQLLMLSGIGPADALNAMNIAPQINLPGVGQNLQDHLEVYFQYRCLEPISLNSRLGLISKGMIGLQWLFLKTGLGVTNHFESCAFIRSAAGVKSPDIQYHFLPGAMRYDGRAAFDGHGFQVHVGPNKPVSRGSVSVVSDDPRQHPRVLFNYLTAEKDVADWRACIRLTREILGQSAMDRFRGEEIAPGIEVQTDAEIDAWVRQSVESAYHPSCTCKMGADDDPAAVLDENCRVRGIDQLRVVDSSIFPTITNGNLNAPTIMVAERAADLIAGNAPLSASDAPVWIDPAWRDNQRTGKPQRDMAGGSATRS